MIFQQVFFLNATDAWIQLGMIAASLYVGVLLRLLIRKKVRSFSSAFFTFLFACLSLGILLPIPSFLLPCSTGLIQLALFVFAALATSSFLRRLVKAKPIRYGGMALAWLITGFYILGLLEPSVDYLKSVHFQVGSVSLSLLGLIKAIGSTGLLVYGATAFSNYLSSKMRKYHHLKTSSQLLIAKVVKTLLIICSVFIGLSLLGIDLSVFSVFAGAIGVGIAFSLQNIFSNFFSGFVILLDRSIKPGDVISLSDGKTYGIVNKLHARYVSVRTREGKEHLIPNQMIITNKLENWSYTDPHIRMEILFRISFDSDLSLAQDILVSIAKNTDRVKAHPEPYVRFSNLVDNAVELKLRLWVVDPQNGTSGIQSDIIFAAWKAFREAGILIPYPPREIHSKRSTDLLEEANITP